CCSTTRAASGKPAGPSKTPTPRARASACATTCWPARRPEPPREGGPRRARKVGSSRRPDQVSINSAGFSEPVDCGGRTTRAGEFAENSLHSPESLHAFEHLLRVLRDAALRRR